MPSLTRAEGSIPLIANNTRKFGKCLGELPDNPSQLPEAECKLFDAGLAERETARQDKDGVRRDRTHSRTASEREHLRGWYVC